MSNIVDLRKSWAMAGDLDPISDIIGALKASKEDILRRMDKQDLQLEKISDKVTDISKTVDSDHAWIEAHGKPGIEQMKESRWKKHGFITALGFSSGLLGSLSPKLGGILTAIFHVP